MVEAMRAAPFLGSGVVNMLKPPGPSSQDLVTDVKRRVGAAKVGHTGTLDPGAAGVLPICIGKATRLFDYMVDKDKRYRFEILFGVTTDTLDSYGKVMARDERACVGEERLRAVLPDFTGDLLQEPPMFSALKVDGKKLYQRARQGTGQEEEREIRKKKARNVQVHRLELVHQTGPNRFMLDMTCSKGTYVRVICEDIARSLGTLGVMTFLLRMASGPFSIESALSLDELGALVEAGRMEEALIPMDIALAHLPAVHVADGFFSPLSNGNDVPAPKEAEGLLDQPLRVYCKDVFFGIGKCEAARIKMHRMLREERQD